MACFSLSVTMQQELQRHQLASNLNATKLPKPCATRWNSFAEALEWCLFYRVALEAFDADSNSAQVIKRSQSPDDSVYGDGLLEQADWALLEQMVCSRLPSCFALYVFVSSLQLFVLLPGFR